MPEPQRSEMLAHGVLLHLSAGDRLWTAGDPADCIGLVERGVMALEQVTAAGEGVIVGLFGPGESLGLATAMQRGRHVTQATALTDRVDVLRLHAAPLLHALPDCPPLALAVNRMLLQHNAVLRAKIDIVSAGSVPRRLAALFAYLIGRFGREAAPGCVCIEPGLTREQIARFVGARTETVVRILSRWQKAGWLEGTRAGFEVRRVDMLRRILGT